MKLMRKHAETLKNIIHTDEGKNLKRIQLPVGMRMVK